MIITMRVIQSILHSSMRYSREYSETLAREITLFMLTNRDEIAQAYNTNDPYDLAEQFTRDYLAEIRS